MNGHENWIKDVKIEKNIAIPAGGSGGNQSTIADFAKYTMQLGDSVLCKTNSHAQYLAKVIRRGYFVAVTRQEPNGTRVWKVRQELPFGPGAI